MANILIVPAGHLVGSLFNQHIRSVPAERLMPIVAGVLQQSSAAPDKIYNLILFLSTNSYGTIGILYLLIRVTTVEECDATDDHPC